MDHTWILIDRYRVYDSLVNLMFKCENCNVMRSARRDYRPGRRGLVCKFISEEILEYEEGMKYIKGSCEDILVKEVLDE